jgi:glutaminyl-peptide cyclotransferase
LLKKSHTEIKRYHLDMINSHRHNLTTITINQKPLYKKHKSRLSLLSAMLLVCFLISACGQGGSLTAAPTRSTLNTPAASPISQAAKTPVTTATPTAANSGEKFSGERALQDLAYQLDLGPRTAGSQAHEEAKKYFISELQKAGWNVEVQTTTYQGQPVENVIGSYGEGAPWVVIGAHYDSRLVSDRDPDPAKRSTPVPGADDGASGAAVLLELARSLPAQLQLAWQDQTAQNPAKPLAKRISLLFIDSEDNGDLPGWDWLLGSLAYVRDLKERPQAAVILDMIGDKDLNIYYERNSDPRLNQEIWQTAFELGYDQEFIPTPKYSMIDDHTPFLQAGIPAADLIDFDFPYHHTAEDTLDKVSAHSLQVVGDVMTRWLVEESEVFK